jgi:hypothetical protein
VEEASTSAPSVSSAGAGIVWIGWFAAALLVLISWTAIGWGVLSFATGYAIPVFGPDEAPWLQFAALLGLASFLWPLLLLLGIRRFPRLAFALRVWLIAGVAFMVAGGISEMLGFGDVFRTGGVTLAGRELDGPLGAFIPAALTAAAVIVAGRPNKRFQQNAASV